MPLWGDPIIWAQSLEYRAREGNGNGVPYSAEVKENLTALAQHIRETATKS
jgi:hypothetical protein